MVRELRERTAFICLPFCYQSLKEGSQDMVRKISNCHLILIPSFALVIVSVKWAELLVSQWEIKFKNQVFTEYAICPFNCLKT